MTQSQYPTTSPPKTNRVQDAEPKEGRHSLVQRLLQDRAYHVEFNGFLTNHVKHAVIALDRLGARSGRIEDYFESYAAETPYGFGLEPARGARTRLTADDWLAYRGQRDDFEALRAFFAAEERRLGLEETLARHLPALSPGFAGGLLHGTIHLGWALDANNVEMVAEGLAYLAFVWVSSHPERPGNPVDDPDVVTTLLRLGDYRDGIAAWLHQTRELPELRPERGFQPQLVGTGAQRVVAQVLERGHPLVDLAPAWLEELPLFELWRQLHEAAALLYLAEPADFVLLHIITALHGLEQIADAAPQSQRRMVVRRGWRALVGILLARGKLVCAETLRNLSRDYARAHVGESAWTPVVARALAEAEEHNPKLVYVQKSLWGRDGKRRLYLDAAARFVATPKVGRFRSQGAAGFKV